MHQFPRTRSSAKSQALNQAQATVTRLAALIPNVATDLSPVTIYQPAQGSFSFQASTGSFDDVAINTSYGVWVAPDVNGGRVCLVRHCRVLRRRRGRRRKATPARAGAAEAARSTRARPSTRSSPVSPTRTSAGCPAAAGSATRREQAAPAPRAPAAAPPFFDLRRLSGWPGES